MHPVSADLARGFANWLQAELQTQDPASSLEQGSDGQFVASLPRGEKTAYQIRFDPGGRQIRVGLATTSRVLNEEIEEHILDSGDELDELLADELIELGAEPAPMNHFFERPWFRYECSLCLRDAAEIDSRPLRERVLLLLKGCTALFDPLLSPPE